MNAAATKPRTSRSRAKAPKTDDTPEAPPAENPGAPAPGTAEAPPAGTAPEAAAPEAPPAENPETPDTPAGTPDAPEAAGTPDAGPQPGGLAEFLDAAAGKLPELPEPAPAGSARAAGGGRVTDTTVYPPYREGETVGVTTHPGARFTVKKVNAVSLVLAPENAPGGATLRIHKAQVTEAPAEGTVPVAVTRLHRGTLARWAGRPVPDAGVSTGDLVVILGASGNGYNAAKLGGHNDQVIRRGPGFAFEPVDPAGVLAPAFSDLAASQDDGQPGAPEEEADATA